MLYWMMWHFKVPQNKFSKQCLQQIFIENTWGLKPWFMWYRICPFPISYDLINSCQVRDKFSSTKLLGTKFSWNRYFVWDIPLWIFQKVPTWLFLTFLVGQKKNCTASVLYLFEVWVPFQTGPFTPIFLGSVRYSCKFAVSSLDRWSLDFPFSYIFEKAQKVKTGFKCPNTTQDFQSWPLKIQAENTAY